MAENSNEDMACIMLTAYGGYDKLQVQRKQRPHPQPGEVVIAVKACGMNFSDLYTRQGLFSFVGKPPFIMGLECSGIVDEIGEGVTDVLVGDRMLCFSFKYGMWAEYVVVSVNQCCKIPDSMSFEEAAALPVNYLTAYFALLDLGHLRSGQSILIQSAAGGVGWAATQLAKTVDNVTIFGTASASKHDVIKANGVTHCIDYHTTDYIAEVLKKSPKGVDIVIDCLSGTDFTKAQKIMKHMGHLIHIGVSNMIVGEKRNIFAALKVWWQTKNVNIINLILKNQAICGFNLASLWDSEPEHCRNAIHNLLQLYENGMVKPHIDSIWTFQEVSEATKKMVNRNIIGKLILVPMKNVQSSTVPDVTQE